MFTNLDVVAYDELNIRKLLHGRMDLYDGDAISFEYQMKKAWGFSRAESARLEPVYKIREAQSIHMSNRDFHISKPWRNGSREQLPGPFVELPGPITRADDAPC